MYCLINHIKKGRESSTVTLTAVLAKSLLLLIIYPTFFLTSCRQSSDIIKIPDNSETLISINTRSSDNLRYADIFFFNDDKLGRLDSYQRISIEGNTKTLKASSRTGKKIIVIVANLYRDRFNWADIHSYSGLCKIYSELKAEDPAFPVMSGECRHIATPKGHCKIELRPLMSKIHIKRIQYDFKGPYYKDESLTDLKLYLTNVNSMCYILPDSTASPGSIINYGKLNEGDISSFTVPEILCKSIDNNKTAEDISLFCYPNISKQATLSSPATRLVIEGKLKGRTVYYPIEINRIDEDSTGIMQGIRRNRNYILDIVLTKAGSDNPDISICGKEAVIKMTIKDWKDTNEQIISY